VGFDGKRLWPKMDREGKCGNAKCGMVEMVEMRSLAVCGTGLLYEQNTDHVMFFYFKINITCNSSTRSKLPRDP
jgi:hypothetical protein